LAHLISQLSLEFSSIWTSLTNQYVTNSQGRMVDAPFYGISLLSIWGHPWTTYHNSDSWTLYCWQ
jgi:hypothetical protein